ncbi:chloride channel protein [Cystobacter fuscus]|uniref:Chloride channel protein n=1 Tax=Cystobacter fuscus TaxID=43 RepID=A0A250JHR8_9BACT|nr:chloride channel protein [Cystobacter fuscus]ATB43425.1 chloride channel protein [Cystobacter fuscus]
MGVPIKSEEPEPPVPTVPRFRPSSLSPSVREFLRSLSGSAQRFWILVVLTGLVSGLSAALLVSFLRWVQRLAWSERGESFLASAMATSASHRVLVTVSGGVLVAVVSLLIRQPLKGHGTASIIESIWVKSGRMQLPRTLFRGVVSIIVVALGAPLGREGALLQSGAATGSALGTRLRLPADQVRLLVACGASAGIAAAYNVPIGGALFGLEVLLGSLALELFGPIVLSCVVATMVSRILIADHPSYLIPAYHLLRPREILLAIAFGPVMGVASALYVRTVNAFAVVLEGGSRVRATLLPVVSMLAVGVAAIWFPQLLGNGYDSVNAALQGHLPLLLLLLLPLLKMVATSLCAGAGIPGGLFTPSLFYGALLGGALGSLAQWVWPGVMPSGAYALLGMGAVLAGTTHASVSAVLIIFELTGNYSIMLPLMLVCVLSAVISRRLCPESLYTSSLLRRNVKLPRASSPNWLRSTDVGALLTPNPPTVRLQTSFQEVVVRLLEVPAGYDLYVTGEDGRLLGVIILDALKGHIPDHSLLGMTVAADVMESSLPRVRIDMSLAEVAYRFGDTFVEHLPVVDEQGLLLGTISKRDILRHGRF